ncbi:glycosyltransferase family 2 protein [Desulfobotulus mexicanus]|uniref:Glycosyltransferase family 2 protein n=1 Tax=Desulfobotulus mexicanus TaxID=2586642 RepID=A0A5Q4VHT8_9BACT|nr:glycosyltransferase family 2 protein [Desulfobotulus mexicanus]TYT75827.1 glycosyltransferase family 2 protein [Desulfobotulus mexicanus]
MYKDKTIGVVIPAHNEETQIGKVIETMPDFVDHIIIVDDCSTDNTTQVIRQYQDKSSHITLISHETNKGVGGAMATAYKCARDMNLDIAVRMDGDGQMDPEDMPALLDPLASGQADYSKGNRLFTGEAYKKIPKVRYFGNAFLSLFTKIASGYWHVADSQSGYTAINHKALKTIDWDQMYPWYGQPNDVLVRLNVNELKVCDVPVTPVYGVGEKSGMKIRKVVFTIGWLLIRLFFWRMKEKYIIRNFHPLIFFYALAFFFHAATFVLFLRMALVWIIVGHIPPINALACFFSFMSGNQFMLFAMWFDMEANKHLK